MEKVELECTSENEVNIELETPAIDVEPVSKPIELELGGIISGIGEEQDPTVPKHVKEIKEEDINNWNNKSNFSGNYDDLNNKPNIPTKTSDLKNDSNFITKDDIPEPTIPLEFNISSNLVEEDGVVSAYTNTGYKVSDKDIQLQTITDSGTSGTNKIVYTDNEIVIIFDGTNKIRRSENGIDFEVIELPCNCKDMVYNSDGNRLYAIDGNTYFMYSDDDGLSWKAISHTYATNTNYLNIGYGKGFKTIRKSLKEITSLTFNETTGNLSLNTRIVSTIVPDFTEMANTTQYIWCNSTGRFKYGAGSRESDFPSLSGVTVNLLKRVNNITFVGLKNNNKIYMLEPSTSITTYKWIQYALPNTCTVNDIIFNPYDETYYIFTSANTYYKTKDFISYDNVDNGLKGTQGYFTLMGIQMTTSNHNELFLAPTRTKLENKAQEWDRALNKERWVGDGLAVDGEQIKILTRSPLNASSSGIGLGVLEEHNFTEDMLEGIYASKAEEKGLFDPYELETWYYEYGIPVDEQYKVTKFIFNQDGSFYDLATWEYEIFVEKYDYGYVFCDANMNIFKYVKLGNLGWLLNSILG